VLSLDQIEGLEPIHENWGDVILGEEIDEGGDPPRVWSPKGAYPGVAFTRSFGDLYAKVIGVHAEPEILIRYLPPSSLCSPFSDQLLISSQRCPAQRSLHHPRLGWSVRVPHESNGCRHGCSKKRSS
jgi:hypothetical protein